MSEANSRDADSSVGRAEKLPRDEQLLEKKRKRKTKKDGTIDLEKNLYSKLLYNEPTSNEESETKREQSKHNAKSKSFSKIFSEEDDIAILEGVIKFKKEKELEARKNMVKFHGFIVESLSFPATRTQLSEKVRRLNVTYSKHVKNGRTPQTPHEVKVFNLCKKIWGQVSEPHSLGEQHHEVSGQSDEHCNISEKPQQKQPNIPKPISILENTMDLKALFDLGMGLTEDLQLIFNAMTRSHANLKQVEPKLFDLYAQSLEVLTKYQKFVVEKAKSPEMQHSPEVIKQEVLKAYFKAKLEHAELEYNASTAFIKKVDDGAGPSGS